MLDKLQQLFFKYSNDSFIRSSAIVFGANFLVNVLNYIFSIIAARMVSVEIYGEYTSLTSLFLLFAVPSAAIAMFVSREVSTQNHKSEASEAFLDKTLNEVIFISFVVWISYILLIPGMSAFLRIEWHLLVFFSLLIPFSLLSSFQIGYLQGRQKFLTTSIINVISTVSKLFISIFLLYLGFSIYGILMALILASIFGILYDRSVYTGRLKFNFKKIDLKQISSHFLAITFFTTLGLAFLQNIDVILAKHFLTSLEAGTYAALSTMGKIIIFAVGAFVTVMMPMVSRGHGTGNGDDKKVFQVALLSVATLGTSIVLAFNTFPSFFVHILFGLKYEGVANYIGEFSFAMLFIALSIVFINFFIATRNKYFIYLVFAGLLVEFALLWYTEKNIGEYVFSVTVSSFIILILLILNFVYEKNIHNRPHV